MACRRLLSDAKRLCPPIDVDATSKVFKNTSNWELARASIMFYCASTPWIMNPARNLILRAFDAQEGPLASTLLWVVKQTVFRHFCGGTNLSECHSVAESSERNGIRLIVDHSVEDRRTDL